VTRERRDEVIFVAVVLSVAIHVALMLLVRAQKLATPYVQPERIRHETTKIVSRETPVDAAKIEELLDLKPLKDLPVAEVAMKLPTSSGLGAAEENLPEAPKAEMTEPPVPEAPEFEAKTVGAELVERKPILETPAAPPNSPKPEFSMDVPGGALGMVGMTPPIKGDWEKSVGTISRVSEGTLDFKPSKEVYDRVDAMAVDAANRAVRALVNAEEAFDLEKSVVVSMTSQVNEGWRYFKVRMSPRASLEVVPKDVVVLLDGSGSIGNDRLKGCRAATKRILRSCTNTGDRFNLVVFRNAFSYAFRTWQECDAVGFEAADKWLGKQSSHGRTDVFSTVASVLTLPRDPKRPLIALVVTDGEANVGVSDTAEIISKFTALNDGLISVYMYGVKTSANLELIDVLTHGNRGESLIYKGMRWSTGDDIDKLSERFRDPVLSDLRIVFSTISGAEAYPTRLRNIYRGADLTFVGRTSLSTEKVAFSLKGQSGGRAFESFFALKFMDFKTEDTLRDEWNREKAIDLRLK